jgi:hypothetical protein
MVLLTEEFPNGATAEALVAAGYTGDFAALKRQQIEQLALLAWWSRPAQLTLWSLPTLRRSFEHFRAVLPVCGGAVVGDVLTVSLSAPGVRNARVTALLRPKYLPPFLPPEPLQCRSGSVSNGLFGVPCFQNKPSEISDSFPVNLQQVSDFGKRSRGLSHKFIHIFTGSE